MRIAAYIRVSTEGQIDGYGLDAQEASIRDFCAKNGHTIAAMPNGGEAIFREEGVSGKNELDDRIALVELNDFCESIGITSIVIPELSRLARDLMVQESILRDWEKRGWSVLSVKEPDLAGNDPTRRFIRQVLGAVNEYDRSMIIARMRAGRIAKARTGQHASGAIPLGYTSYDANGKRQRRVDEASASVVKRIFALRAEGLSLQAIADVLNAEGVTPPRAERWWKTTVGSMLRNPAYHGVVSYHEDGQTLAEAYNEKLRLI